MAAAFDKRRANGPEESAPPIYNIKAATIGGSSADAWGADDHRLIQMPQPLPAEQLAVCDERAGADDSSSLPRLVLKDPLGLRDGRGAMDARPMHIQTSIIPTASGSALLECGRTKIACAVHGPRQSRGRQYASKALLSVLFQCAPFSGQERRKPGKDVELPELGAIVEQALLPAVRLELLPKASIDIHITVLDQDTSVLGGVALAVTAASAALAEAGVEMLGLVTGASASALTPLPSSGKDQQWVVDPSQEEAAHASAHLMVCSLPALGRTTCYTLRGPVYNWNQLQTVRNQLAATLLTNQVTDTLYSITQKVHSVTAQALYGLVPAPTS